MHKYAHIFLIVSPYPIFLGFVVFPYPFVSRICVPCLCPYFITYDTRASCIELSFFMYILINFLRIRSCIGTLDSFLILFLIFYLMNL